MCAGGVDTVGVSGGCWGWVRGDGCMETVEGGDVQSINMASKKLGEEIYGVLWHQEVHVPTVGSQTQSKPQRRATGVRGSPAGSADPSTTPPRPLPRRPLSPSKSGPRTLLFTSRLPPRTWRQANFLAGTLEPITTFPTHENGCLTRPGFHEITTNPSPSTANPAPD